MSYPKNTGAALKYLGYALDADFSLASLGGVLDIERWTHADPKPSTSDIDAVLADSAFIQWLEINGGDATKTRRHRAKNDGIDGDQPLSVAQRAEMGERNKRDNYLVQRIIELQDALAAMKRSAGVDSGIRAAIPDSFMASGTRSRADARSDLKAEIDSGNSDS